MKKIFLDTNILLDVFLERKHFLQAAQRIWTLCEEKIVHGSISAISVNNVFFVIKKLANTEKAYQAVGILLDCFKVIEVNQNNLSKAYGLMFPDFEDAIQYQSALQWGAQVLITRNSTGFKNSEISIMDAAMYLSRYHL